ncbi:MAG: SH3 domain-containing protein [Lachnospiraceae bacterium]|nr:SH3 domain-containing protein [Lachnospiraceae bacterium]
MWKDKMRFLRDAVVRHSKVAFPIIVVAAVAVTVAFALGAGHVEEQMQESRPEETVESTVEEVVLAQEDKEVPLDNKEIEGLYTLMATYYNALANGDVATIQTISNYVEDTEMIRIQELSKYIESYPTIEIYTKEGPVENSYIAYVYTYVTFYGYEQQIPGLMTFYVCTDENGNLYLNEGETAEEVLEYVKTVSLQDDVVELTNKTNTEYNEVLRNNLQLADYISELEREVSQATGEALAEQIAETQTNEGGSDQTPEEGGNVEGEQPSGDTESEQTPAETGPVYAKATTTVNVRSSDSEQADKLGKVSGGTRVQIVEQLANGWIKIVFEGKDGFIKSQYLQIEGSASANTGGDAIKTVKATTNVNMRKEASQTSEKIGVVVGGDTLEVLSEANGWSQVRYNGTVGYVKSEYLQ